MHAKSAGQTLQIQWTSFGIKKNGAVRKHFDSWSVPKPDRELHDLEDGDTLYLELNIDTFSYAGVVTLTSGGEFRLPAKVASDIESRVSQLTGKPIVFSLSSLNRSYSDVQTDLENKLREARKLSSEELGRVNTIAI